MKKFIFLVGSLSTYCFASGGINPGSSLTTGPSSSQYSIFGAAHNPAMAPLMVREGERWRVNYLPSITVGVELGDVSNFADDLDELIDLIEDPSLNEESVEETLDRFNDVLVRMGENGYVKNNLNVSIPIAPLYYDSKSWDGTLFVDVNFAADVSLAIIDDELRYDDAAQTFTTNTSIYLKSGIERRISVGYGRQIMEGHKWLPSEGKLYAGAKVNLYSIELSKQITRLEDLDGAEVEDVIEDEYDNNLKSSSNFGLDVGLVWDAEWYRLGARLQNINSPSFEYGTVGVNCESRPEDTIERNSCEMARAFVNEGRLKAREEHTKNALLSVDGLVKITERWLLTSSLDLAKYDDITGYENQWWNLAMAYDTRGRLIPDWRLGYQSNLAGTKLDTFTAGLTFFNVLSLDVEYSTDSVEVDGSSAPRRFGFSLAFEEHF